MTKVPFPLIFQPESTTSYVSNTPGVKHDEDKVRTDLLSPTALRKLSEVLTHGATKYGDRNWEKGMAFSRVYGAALRHLFAWWEGGDIDPDSGQAHLDHAACCLHFLQHYKEYDEYDDYDDRPALGNNGHTGPALRPLDV